MQEITEKTVGDILSTAALHISFSLCLLIVMFNICKLSRSI